MFLAVQKYNFRKNSNSILVFDTDDLTVEEVSYDTLFQLKNDLTIYNTYSTDSFWNIENASFLELLRDYVVSDTICYKDGILYIRGRAPIRIETKTNGLYVNGRRCIKHKNCMVHYLFKYRDYIVFRGTYMISFGASCYTAGWYTVFVSRDGVVDCYESIGESFQSIDPSKATNKVIAVQLETLTGGI